MSKKYTVRLEPLGKVLKANPGTPLMDILDEYGIEFPCGGKGSCHKCKIRILDGNIKTDHAYEGVLQAEGMDSAWSLTCKGSINQNVTIEIAQQDAFILADSTAFPFEPSDGYGLAVDLGTSTIVMQLINLSSGHIMDVYASLNPQSRFGADIISRITHALHQPGLEILCRLIREHLWKLIHRILERNRVVPRKIILVGNTVMHHLFAGIDVRSLAFFPFKTSEGGKRLFRASELGWDLPRETAIIFMPTLGSFVGSDILAGILATGIDTSEDLIALIDLGTNGEIVVGNRDLMLTASTAAGPAFEGTNISQGMRATNGAISRVILSDSKVEFHVIGNEKPRGICGSGLIDAVSVFLHTGQINVTGQIVSGESSLAITETVNLTQKDIYEYILAKSAIASGIHILLSMLGKSNHDISKVFIAGGFGHFITISNAIFTGLLEFPENKIVKAGNTALIGTKMLLFRKDNHEKSVVERIRHVSLESDTDFQDVLVRKMILKNTL
jgi:uncharacterized 2Fe-2S/4Fe-4S cluster protein (DUF4445 family)